MVGNRVFGHALILCMAVALLLTPWGSLPQDDPTIQPSVRSEVITQSLRFVEASSDAEAQLVSGWNGNVAIGRVLIPYWAIVACLALGSVVSSLNWLRFTQLSSIVTFALFGMAAACALVSIIHLAVAGQVGTGAVLAITCALAGLAMSPSDSVSARPVIHKFESALPEHRKAA